MATRAKPLSPHLGIYRWQYTMALSIANRVTGVALSVSILAFVYWLAAVAAGPEPYAQAQQILTSPLALVVFAAATFCFFFHLCNGIRHLVWDLGYGFELPTARASGWTVVIVSLVLTAAFWIALKALMSGGAP
jgi:succinate dehydrogenase / fumarate reductase cytochrome b subunit